MNSVFNTQCKTFAIAKNITGKSNVSTVSDAINAPYCMRVVKKYRTPEIKAFRDRVAAEARRLRGQ